MRDKFTKKDLRNGMIVEHRNGDRAIVLNEYIVGYGFIRIEELTDDLRNDPKYDLPEHDIVKVFESKKCVDKRLLFDDAFLELVFERKEESEIVKAINSVFKDFQEAKYGYAYKYLKLLDFCDGKDCGKCPFLDFNCNFGNMTSMEIDKMYERLMAYEQCNK